MDPVIVIKLCFVLGNENWINCGVYKRIKHGYLIGNYNFILLVMGDVLNIHLYSTMMALDLGSNWIWG